MAYELIMVATRTILLEVSGNAVRAVVQHVVILAIKSVFFEIATGSNTIEMMKERTQNTKHVLIVLLQYIF